MIVKTKSACILHDHDNVVLKVSHWGFAKNPDATFRVPATPFWQERAMNGQLIMVLEKGEQHTDLVQDETNNVIDTMVESGDLKQRKKKAKNHVDLTEKEQQ